MNTKHTAGPWRVELYEGEHPYIISEQGKRWDNPVVCNLYDDVTPNDSVTMGAWYESCDNAKANARLIAAAPELLEALEGVYRIIEAFGYTTALGKTQKARMDAARSAIAKAKGEALP